MERVYDSGMRKFTKGSNRYISWNNEEYAVENADEKPHNFTMETNNAAISQYILYMFHK